MTKLFIAASLALFAGAALADPVTTFSPTLTQPTIQGGGIINIGQALGPFLQPYVDAAVQALILAGVSWLGVVLKQKFNISIDEGHRDALTTFLQNRASSLIADGAVRMQGLQVKVDSAALAAAVNSINDGAAGAAKHFGITPDMIAAKIIDAIPQVPAGAAIVAQAHDPQNAGAIAAAPASSAAAPASSVKTPGEVSGTDIKDAAAPAKI